MRSQVMSCMRNGPEPTYPGGCSTFRSRVLTISSHPRGDEQNQQKIRVRKGDIFLLQILMARCNIGWKVHYKAFKNEARNDVSLHDFPFNAIPSPRQMSSPNVDAERFPFIREQVRYPLTFTHLGDSPSGSFPLNLGKQLLPDSCRFISLNLSCTAAFTFSSTYGEVRGGEKPVSSGCTIQILLALMATTHRRTDSYDGQNFYLLQSSDEYAR